MTFLFQISSITEYKAYTDNNVLNESAGMNTNQLRRIQLIDNVCRYHCRAETDITVSRDFLQNPVHWGPRTGFEKVAFIFASKQIAVCMW